MIHIITAVAVVFLICFLFTQSFGAVSYVIQDLGLLGDSSASARGISDSGLVAGYYTSADNYTPVIWHPGGSTSFLACDKGGEALDINSNGQAVGWVYTQQGRQAVMWGTNGNMTALPIPSGLVDPSACAISDTGWIAGNAMQISTPVAAALLWAPGQTAQSYRVGPSDVFSACDVNNSGMGVGYAIRGKLDPGAVVFANGWDIIAGGATNSAALAFGVSNSGYIAGYYNGRPVVWNPDLSVVILDDAGGRAYAVNDAGLAVDESGSGATAWSITGEKWVLPTLGRGSTAIAYDINASGWIVGDCKDAAGRTHAVLWQPSSVVPDPDPDPEPVPEPTTALYALSCVLAGTGLLRRKRTTAPS